LSEREQIRSKSKDTTDDVENEAINSKVDTASTDSLLDESDLVLEKNAAEFIKGFVQKGGE
jgi:ubiquitin-like protein Pup